METEGTRQRRVERYRRNQIKRTRGKKMPLYGHFLLQALLRAAVLSPLCFLSAPVRGEALAPVLVLDGVLLLTVIALYIFLVMPLRFCAVDKLKGYIGEPVSPGLNKASYRAYLRAVLLRLRRVALWGWAFVICLGFWVWFSYYGMEFWLYNDLVKFIGSFARLIGQKDNMQGGLIVLGVLSFFSTAFMMYGWQRDMPMDFLDVKDPKLPLAQTTNKIRKMGKSALSANASANLMVVVISLAVMAGVLLPYVLDNLKVSADSMRMLQGILRLIKQPLPPWVIAGLAGVLVVVYIPLCVVRKVCNAVIMQRLTAGEQTEAGKENAAG